MSSTSQEKSFVVSVAEHLAVKLIGIKIRTNMQTCMADCPRLWEDTFVPWIHKLYPENNCPSWGASTAYDAATGSFDYWALVKAPEGQPVPKELKAFTLPAGLYAQCLLTSIAEIHTAYHYLYSRWSSQTGYARLEDGVSFEYYGSDYLQTGRLSIYIPIAKS